MSPSVLVLNAGSSSLKFALYDLAGSLPLRLKGAATRLGSGQAALRATAGGGHPKVVFCTTENEPAIVGRGIAAGADGFVTKPFDDQTLSAKLQRIGAT